MSSVKDDVRRFMQRRGNGWAGWVSVQIANALYRDISNAKVRQVMKALDALEAEGRLKAEGGEWYWVPRKDRKAKQLTA